MNKKLIDAVAKGDLKGVKKMFDINSIDKKDAEDLLIGATIGGFEEILKLLLEQGVSPNAKDNEGRWTALHFAADECNISIAKVLIKYGADVNGVDEDGSIPLFKAVFNRNKCPEMLKLLVQSGSDIRKKNKHNVSSIDLATRFDIDLVNL